MPHNLFQDMVKVKRERRGADRVFDSAQTESQDLSEVIKKETRQFKASNHRGEHRYKLWFVAIISIIFFLFSLSYLFSLATITVTPKSQAISLNATFTASKAADASALPFDLVVISGEESKIISSTLEEEVSKAATGTVTIFNNFSSATQRLDIDTRLEGSNGKIYKTQKQITVPGMRGTTPGSVEVGIYAALAGEAHNSDPLDFTIVGFKGTSKYAKFYARSNGAITGGLQGTFPVIADAERANVENELKNILQVKLYQKATDQIPNGFLLFKDAVFLNINDSDIEKTSTEDNAFSIKIKGTLYGLLFNEQKLSEKIAEKNIQDYDDSAVYIPNIRDLTFSLSKQVDFVGEDYASFRDIKNLDFNLKGEGKIVWQVDADQLKSDLLGKPKSDFNQILFQYPNIEMAEVALRPFWKRSFPDKTKDIKVIIEELQ
ncbi:MAG: hypothetical protein WD963_01755 [Candidatus Paceibacterota bacterium]